MIVSGWSGGNATFGIRVGVSDMYYFNKSWVSINITINGQGGSKAFSLAPSFWTGCNEIRGVDIRSFIYDRGYITDGTSSSAGQRWQKILTRWPKGQPPRFNLDSLGGNNFKLY